MMAAIVETKDLAKKQEGQRILENVKTTLIDRKEEEKREAEETSYATSSIKSIYGC